MPPQLLRVAPDNALAMEIVLRETTRLGYRRPGLVAPAPFDLRSRYLHSAQFLRWLRIHRLNSRLLLAADPPAPALAAWIRALRPDVVICPHCDLYVARWREAVTRCAPPPAFVSLAWSDRTAAFAGVDKRTEEIGRFGIDLLLNALTQGHVGFQADPPTLRVPGCWRGGPSCPPAAHRGPALRRLLRALPAP